MRHLRPRIADLRKRLAQQIQSIGSQIFSVRKDDIRANFANELTQQLFERMSLEKVLKPYIDPRFSLTKSATQFFEISFQRSYLVGYLYQPEQDTNDIGAAESAVKQIVAELDALIDGKTLLEIPAPPEPARPKKIEPKETPPQLTREEIIENARRAAAESVGRA
jgi:hypothetical protein